MLQYRGIRDHTEIEVKLPEELEREMQKIAHERGCTINELIAAELETYFLLMNKEDT